jgi:hypothetical protein
VTCASAAECWAVGAYGSFASDDFSQNEIMRWNGKKWSKLTTPNPGGTSDGSNSELISLTCASSTECWGAGFYGSVGSANFSANQIPRWNGKKWSKVATPSPAGTSGGDSSELFAIRCSAPARCWAVGSANKATGHEFDVALHWKGSAWSQG